MVMVSFKEFVSMVHKYDPLKDQGPIEVRRRSFLNAEHYAQTPISLKRAFTAFFRGNEIVQLSRTDVFNSALNDDVDLFVLKVLFWGFNKNQRGRCRYVFESWKEVRSYASDLLVSPNITSEQYKNQYLPKIKKCNHVDIAFFSKLMYFAKASIDGHKCIILDSNVVNGIKCIDDKRFDRLRAVTKHYSSSSYVSFLEQISILIEDPQLKVEPDRIEYALFLIGKKQKQK